MYIKFHREFCTLSIQFHYVFPRLSQCDQPCSFLSNFLKRFNMWLWLPIKTEILPRAKKKLTFVVPSSSNVPILLMFLRYKTEWLYDHGSVSDCVNRPRDSYRLWWYVEDIIIKIELCNGKNIFTTVYTKLDGVCLIIIWSVHVIKFLIAVTYS